MSTGWGKFYAKAFTGSMFGSGLNVFAVWGYAIANARPPEGEVELNPAYLAAVLGTNQEEINSAILFLESPDNNSRSEEEEGRRIIKIGQNNYRLVNFIKYREGVDDEARKTYFRDKMRAFRAAKTTIVKPNVFNSSDTVTQAEAEAEADNSPNSKPYKLSCYFLQLLLDRKPDLKKPNLQIWIKSFDRMIRLDKRNPDQIAKVLEWSQKDNFWKKNILSPDTLRKQFDRIEIQMEGK